MTDAREFESLVLYHASVAERLMHLTLNQRPRGFKSHPMHQSWDVNSTGLESRLLSDETGVRVLHVPPTCTRSSVDESSEFLPRWSGVQFSPGAPVARSFNGRTPVFHTENKGSTPLRATNAIVRQLARRLDSHSSNPGSSPGYRTIDRVAQAHRASSS